MEVEIWEFEAEATGELYVYGIIFVCNRSLESSPVLFSRERSELWFIQNNSKLLF